MEKSPVIPPNFVTLRDLKERREREQLLKQQSAQVEKEEDGEVKGPLIAPVHIKEEEKQEGSSNNFPPKPPKCTTNQNRSRGRGHPKQSAIIGTKEEVKESTFLKHTTNQDRSRGRGHPKQSAVIGAKAAVKESTSLNHTTNQNRGRGWGPPKQRTIIGVQASANGSTSNAEKKKESDAEVAGVITELSLTGLSCASEVTKGEKRTKATAAVVNGGKTGSRVGLDNETRISDLHINGRNSNSKREGKGIGIGRGYRNNWQKSSSSAGEVWVVKKSLNQKDGVADNK